MSMKKRVLSIVLSLVMLVGMFSLIGVSASAASFSEGTYSATITKNAMGGKITYNISVSLSGGKYTYNVSTNVSVGDERDGAAAPETYTGTYTVNSDNLSFNGGNLKSGKAKDANTLELTGKLSSYAFSDETITVTKPAAPSTDNAGGGFFAGIINFFRSILDFFLNLFK